MRSTDSAGPQRSARLLWEVYAHIYDRIWDSPLTWMLGEELLSLAPADGRVIDLGCGTGLIARRFRAAGYEVVGVDSSRAMLQRAADRGRVDAAHLADAGRSGIPDAAGSLVIVSNVLHLAASPTAVLAEAQRIAGPRGVVILTWPTATATLNQLLRIDLRTGRSLADTLCADLLRRGVGVLASLVRVRVRRAAALEAQVRAAVPHFRLTGTTFAGCQQILVLEPNRAAAARERQDEPVLES